MISNLIDRLISRSRNKASRSRMVASQRTRMKKKFFLETLEDRRLLTTLFWQGDVNSNWSEAGNWNTLQDGTGTDQAPQAANNDVLIFDTNTPGVGNFANNNDIVGLTGIEIQIVDDDANTFNISGNSLGLAANGISFTSSNGNALVSTPLTLAEPTTVVETGFAGRLTLSGNITNGGNLLNLLSGAISVQGQISGAGGLASSASSVILSAANTYSGITTVNGGTLNVSLDGGLGTTSGGTVVNSGFLLIESNYTIAEPLTLDGGTLTNQGSNATFAGQITLASDSRIDANLGTFELTGQITGPGGFTKTGNDVLTLTNTNSYSGTTNVDAGTLLVNGSNSAASTVDVNTGAMLGGTGNVLGPVNVNSGGTLSPGVSPGIMMTGDLDLMAGSTFTVELDGDGGTTPATPGASNFDQVRVTGGVTLAGTLSLIESFTPAPGQSFVIIDNDGSDAVNGTFAGLAEGAIVDPDFNGSGQPVRITYAGGDGNDVVLLTEAPTLFWQGDDATSPTLWSVAENWNTMQDGSGTARVPASGNVLVFDTNTPGVGSFASNNDISGLTGIEIQIVDDNANDFQISGNSIELAANGISQSASSIFGATITTPLTLAVSTNISNSGTAILQLTLNLANAGQLLTFGGDQLTQLSGVLSGPGGVTVNATVHFSEANTYDGLTTIGSSGRVVIFPGGELGSTAAGTVVNTGGTLVLNVGATVLAEPLTLDGGKLSAANGTATFPGPITLASNSTLSATGGDLTLTGPITGAGGFTKDGGNILTLANANSYTGPTNVTQGTLKAANESAFFSSSNVALAASTFLDLGETSNVIVRQLTGSGTVVGGSATPSINLIGNSTFDGAIEDGGATTTDVRFANGTITSQTTVLTGTHTYTGTTSINNNATLVVDGQIGPAGLVTVGFNTGGATLAGSGVINADVQVDDELSPGNGSADELTTNNLTFTGNSRYTVDVQGAAAGQFDQTIVNGTVTLAGTLAVVETFTPAPGQSFVIIANDGVDAVSGTFNGLAEGAIVDADFNGSGVTVRITYVGGDGNDVALVADTSTLYWQGDDATNPTLWSVAANWNSLQNGSGIARTPVNGNVLVFDTNTPGVGGFTNNNDMVGLTGIEIQVVDDDANTFSISGNSLGLAANGITRTTTNGSTSISMPFTLAAPTVITNTITGDGGSLELGGDIANGGHLLTFIGSTTGYSGILSGTGGVTVDGAVVFSTANTYDGVTTITTGSLGLLPGATLGSTTGATIVNASGSLTLTQGATITDEVLTLEGGQFVAINTPTSTYTGPITITADTNISAGANGDLTLTGPITGAGGITKTGERVLTLTNNNGYTGVTNVNAGTLLVNGSTAVGSTVNVNSGGKLGGTGNVQGPVNVNSGGTLSPGLSPGIIMTGNLNLMDGAAFDIEIENPGATPGTDYDQTQVTGTVTIGNLTFNLTGGRTPVAGDRFIIIDNDLADPVVLGANAPAEGSVVGTLNGIPLLISYVGGDGNDVVLEYVLGSIHGFKYEDVNGNGVFEAGVDTPLAGVSFALTGTDAQGNVINTTAVTGANGEFEFTGILASVNGTGPATGYTVTETVPAGFVATTPTVFTTNLSSRQELVAFAGQAIIPPGDPRTEVVVGAPLMFGNTVYGSIHGFKFFDVNDNGVQDPNEGPQAGVTFTLTGTDGLGMAVNMTSLTDANGFFAFTNLPPSVAGQGLGTGYTITETVPSGFIPTGMNPRSTPLRSREELVAVAGQAMIPTNDPRMEIVLGNDLTFGNFMPAEIHGYKFDDRNADSTENPGEPRLNGITMYLDLNNNMQLDFGEPTSVTADRDLSGNGTIEPATERGLYSFLRLIPGTYTVREVLTPSEVLTTPATGSVTVTIATGQALVAVAGLSPTPGLTEVVTPGLIFGNSLPGQIHGHKFNDLNGDGVEDPGDPRLNGWTITLTDSAGNQVTDASGNIVQPVVTAALDLNGDGTISAAENGLYGFTNLIAGTYVVRETAQLGFAQTTSNPQPLTITRGEVYVGQAGEGMVPGPRAETVDNRLRFGNTLTASIHGFKYNDLDRDGTFDVGETARAGVTFTLTTAAGAPVLDASRNVVGPQVTDANGFFGFTNLLPGTYIVTEVIPAGQQSTNPPVARPFTITAGQELVARLNQAGLQPGDARTEVVRGADLEWGNAPLLGSIHGHKFEDIDGDGVQDPGEPRLNGWTISLTDFAGNQVTDAFGNIVQPVVTASQDLNGDGTISATEVGLYWFTNLRPGTYVVRETVQAGFVQTTRDPQPTSITGGQVYVAQFDQAMLPAGDPRTVIVDNGLGFGNQVRGEITWTKVNKSGELLGGVIFTLTRTHSFNQVTGVFTDIVDVPITVHDNLLPDVDPVFGRFTVQELPLGRYTLAEATPIPGYDPDTFIETFNITNTNNFHVATHTWMNTWSKRAFVGSTFALRLDYLAQIGLAEPMLNAPAAAPANAVVPAPEGPPVARLAQPLIAEAEEEIEAETPIAAEAELVTEPQAEQVDIASANKTNGVSAEAEGSAVASALRQNSSNRFDVNGDGEVTPLDVLIAINLIDDPSSQSNQGSIQYYCDVNGDGQLTPLDVLQVANLIDARVVQAEGEAPQSAVRASSARDVVMADYDDLYRTNEIAGMLTPSKPIESQFNAGGDSSVDEEDSDDELDSILAVLAVI